MMPVKLDCAFATAAKAQVIHVTITSSLIADGHPMVSVFMVVLLLF